MAQNLKKKKQLPVLVLTCSVSSVNQETVSLVPHHISLLIFALSASPWLLRCSPGDSQKVQTSFVTRFGVQV